MSTLVAARLNDQMMQQFELAAKLKKRSKSQLLQDMIKHYLEEDKQLALLVKDAKRLAKHEREHPDAYADLYHHEDFE
jgi:predicted DNA-binding protein